MEMEALEPDLGKLHDASEVAAQAIERIVYLGAKDLHAKYIMTKIPAYLSDFCRDLSKQLVTQAMMFHDKGETRTSQKKKWNEEEEPVSLFLRVYCLRIYSKGNEQIGFLGSAVCEDHGSGDSLGFESNEFFEFKESVKESAFEQFFKGSWTFFEYDEHAQESCKTREQQELRRLQGGVQGSGREETAGGC
jgi:hypothetical protein